MTAASRPFGPLISRCRELVIRSTTMARRAGGSGDGDAVEVAGVRRPQGVAVEGGVALARGAVAAHDGVGGEVDVDDGRLAAADPGVSATDVEPVALHPIDAVADDDR